MKYKLLIIDDIDLSCNTLKKCFPWEQFGFEPIGQATNGQTALEFLKTTPVDVLLSDINMPIMDGIEMAKNLATQKNPPVIIFFSGYRDFDYARQAIAYGVRFYLLKPIKYEDLVDTFTTVKSELDQKQLVSTRPVFSAEQELFISKVHTYVDQNLNTANLKNLSDQLYMNQCYVSQLYKQKTGENFSDYLRKTRMEKAAKLLGTSTQKISTISNIIGYNNAKNFSRAFLSYYGVTPTEYRDIHRAKQ